MRVIPPGSLVLTGSTLGNPPFRVLVEAAAAGGFAGLSLWPRPSYHRARSEGLSDRELRAMLEPFDVRSPMAGTIASLLSEGSSVRAGGLLARIRDLKGNVQEFRSPLDGTIAKSLVKEGDPVAASRTIVMLDPDNNTIRDALRALAYVGTKEDLALIESCAQTSKAAEVRTEAAASAKAIRNRVENAAK